MKASAGVFFVLLSVVTAQLNDTVVPSVSNNTATLVNTSSSVNESLSETLFINEAISGGLYEILSSNIAINSGLSLALQSFAQRMIQDHTFINHELLKLAQANGFSVPNTTNMMQLLLPAHQSLLSSLSATPNQSFPAVYTQDQVRAHEEAVQLFTRATQELTNYDFQNFAFRMLPILQEHLSHILSLVNGSAALPLNWNLPNTTNTWTSSNGSLPNPVIPSTGPFSHLTVGETLTQIPELSLLTRLMSTAVSPVLTELLGFLTSPYINATLFAPINDAITSAGTDGTINLADPALLVQLPQYHVVPQAWSSAQIPPVLFMETLLTDSAYVNTAPGRGQVLQLLRNGTLLEVVMGIPGFTSHTANIIQADIQCSNGIVHLIDRVLSFPKNLSTTIQLLPLNRFHDALRDANLTQTIEEMQGITIFAPSDLAFSFLNTAENTSSDSGEALNYPGTGRRLLEQNDDLRALRNAVKYHIAHGLYFSTDLSQRSAWQLNTLQGQLSVSVNNGYVMLDNTTVILRSDIMLKNGVLHIIDRVLGDRNAFMHRPVSHNDSLSHENVNRNDQQRDGGTSQSGDAGVNNPLEERNIHVDAPSSSGSFRPTWWIAFVITMIGSYLWAL